MLRSSHLQDYDFEGKVTIRTGNQLSIDSCLDAGSCSSSIYQFTICASSGNCQAVPSPAPVEVAIPIGRRVRVVWHLDNDAPGYSRGLYFLAIYDREPSSGTGNIFFVGSGGRRDSVTSGAQNPLKDLPFSVSSQALGCGQPPMDARSYLDADDYAFVFATKDASATSLQLSTGASGPLSLASPAGGVQTLEFHCLDAVQPEHTDDYWNWDFWARGNVVSAPIDGSAN